MFCCAPFVLFLRRVWVDGAQGRRKNVANIQCCQCQFSVPMWMCRGYGGKLAIGNIGNGNTFTLETLA
jgi:hypothetical protein